MICKVPKIKKPVLENNLLDGRLSLSNNTAETAVGHL